MTDQYTLTNEELLARTNPVSKEDQDFFARLTSFAEYHDKY